MPGAYMNVRMEPLELQHASNNGLSGGSIDDFGGRPSGRSGFQRALASELQRQQRQAGIELDSDYTSMSDADAAYTSMPDEEAASQADFSDHWASLKSPFGYLSSWLVADEALSTAQESENRVGSARSSSSGSFTDAFVGARDAVRTITPAFLRTEAEEDFSNSCCPNLGFKARLVGCVACFCLGQLLQIASIGGMAGVLIGRPGRFATCYTLGNLFMLGASFFLVGPKAQFNKCRAKDRLLTSSLFFGAMTLTLVVVFAGDFFGRALVILILVVVQGLAAIWYILSYIPYGQSFGKRAAKRVLKCFGIF